MKMIKCGIYISFMDQHFRFTNSINCIHVVYLYASSCVLSDVMLWHKVFRIQDDHKEILCLPPYKRSKDNTGCPTKQDSSKTI